MTLIEALTAVRPQDGKVADYADCTRAGYIRVLKPKDKLDPLQCCWPQSHGIVSEPTDFHPSFDQLTHTFWIPGWKKIPEIIPQSGEVWEDREGDRYWVEERSCRGASYLISIYGEQLWRSDIVHDYNGWHRVFPAVEK